MNNQLLKNILKESIFRFLSWINKFVPKNEKTVLLYVTKNRFVYNLEPLRNYMLEHKYDQKYNISCGILDYEKYGNRAWVEYYAFIKSVWTFLNAKYVFYTCGQIPIKPSVKQTVIHLEHGNCAFKTGGKLSNVNFGDQYFFTYVIATSDLYVPIMAEEFGCPEDCVKVAGEPMADSLLLPPQKKYNFQSYDKVLVWMPTFRNSELMGYSDSNLESLVPLYEDEEYPLLNDLLAQYNIKLIVKLHPIQTVPKDLQRHFSHLSVYSHDEFVKNEYEMYTLLANSDGLIGDYSSVSMQYLFTDKPQAFVVPDLNSYASNRGFIFENPEDYMAGHIIKTKEEFKQFIDDFASNKDLFKDKRHWVCNQIFKYKDAKSCERIVKLSGMSL
ncbi:CDP-glycerol glycerophosphotransferase family protein [uncultured Muribaculum sp.]|uniref:CDP-glycerol glycerophosphotransferase family protein n=1 Tax=uncultured Muribaculum sp. TaxID=1918613 RepID=UPI0025B09866|nr:CDP-glycerol glycerophosphotransferase family protein [uncultured Muribaculum sp.]